VRLPFPDRISLFYVTGFATVLCIAQLMEGTPPLFSLCCFLFIIISGFAFNLAGGFSQTSGSYIFFYSVLTVIFGVFWKAVLGEPADSNLSAPQVTIEAFLGSISVMLAAVYVSKKITRKRPFLADVLSDANMRNATIGCMIVGTLLLILKVVSPGDSGSILSALSQLNRFLFLGIMLGVIHQIRKTGGASSINLVGLLSVAIVFFIGLTGFSKEGMFSPFLCWLFAAASQRYRISLYQAIGICLAGAFMVFYLVPFSQYGRNYKTESFSENISTSFSLLTQLGYVKEQYALIQEDARDQGRLGYYNTSQGFIDRLTILPIDDGLISLTEEKGKFGYRPMVLAFANLVPHVFWPGKPDLHYGNLYAHELGNVVAEEDTTTGISFSPTGEAFHLERWIGILLMAPVIWIMLFTFFDSLCGDTRKAPWGLLVTVLYSHVAAESMLSGLVYVIGYIGFGIIFIAFATGYVMPILGTLVAGPEKTSLRRIAPIRSLSGRAPRVRSSAG
jgi:hypothetical protein